MIVAHIAVAATVALAACAPIKLLNQHVPDTGYVREEGIAYGPLARQKLDVYRPKVVPPSAPVVVFFYGGAWRIGERRDYLFVGEALTAIGCVAAVADYRLYPEGRFPLFLEDGALATRWLRDHARQYGGDQHELYLMGHSAGAHLAAMLATDPQYLAAVGVKRSEVRGLIGVSGPYVLDTFPLTRWGPVFASTRNDLARAMPISYVTGHEPPMLLLSGDDDWWVPRRNTEAMAARVRAMGGEVVERHFPGLDHKVAIGAVGAPVRDQYAVLQEIDRFIHAHTAAERRH
jgi:acetyl esterase/lipase